MAEEVTSVVKKFPVKIILALLGGFALVTVVAVVSGGGVWFLNNKKTEELQSKYDKLEDEKKECMYDLDLYKEGENDECKCPACECDECEECEECDECEYSSELVLPQVNYLAKAYYSQQDLTDLQEKVIDPIVEYYEDLGQTVVSIDIDNDNRGGSDKSEFIVSVIISDNDGDSDPIYMGFIHHKVDGEIPEWEPITM
ncbi:MAG TPA: hypothetical protein PLL26_03275 [Candidatus Dojkabacteria bacterium]|nr:hypothetical protein [Candidatus Dojkabacteria bacterium]